MRALGIELVDEGVESGLLLQAVAAGRGAVSFFSVRCMRSWRPFCCGLPGLMRSMAMPSLSQKTESLDRLNRAFGLAKGTPLSVRIAAGQAALAE